MADVSNGTAWFRRGDSDSSKSLIWPPPVGVTYTADELEEIFKNETDAAKKEEIRQQYIEMQSKFYTRAEADERYMNMDEVRAKAALLGVPFGLGLLIDAIAFAMSKKPKPGQYSFNEGKLSIIGGGASTPSLTFSQIDNRITIHCSLVRGEKGKDAK
jgi:hypothetical protein